MRKIIWLSFEANLEQANRLNRYLLGEVVTWGDPPQQAVAIIGDQAAETVFKRLQSLSKQQNVKPADVSQPVM